MPNQTDGSWDSIKQWPLIGLHAIVMDDGRVLTFGTDANGMQGGQFIYDIYDPVTDTHQTLQNTTPTDIFCSAAVIIPGTNKILIAGGDARPLGSVNKGVADVNILDMDTGELYPAPEGDMAFQRWYPTMVSLPTGQMIMLGGTDINGRGISTPEIYTDGVGWQSLTGAIDTDLASSSLYPRAFVADDGDIIYFATGKGNDAQVEVMSLNPNGNGTLTQIGTVPFNVAWDAPAVMYEAGKILIQDAQTGLWSMDINSDTPVFTRVGTLSQERNWSNMTTLADGTVLINGGTRNGNTEAGADKTAVIWDPADNSLDYTVDEVNPRLYHSASVLLNDGTLLSLGGGAAGSAENNYLDGQVYRPPYLYDANGNLAERPVILSSPEAVNPGGEITITLDDASDIQKLTFVKSGAATHALNMEARMVELDFTVGTNNTIEVTIPDLSGGVTAGSWMLFAWDGNGVPSVAPMVNINPAAVDGWDYVPPNQNDVIDTPNVTEFLTGTAADDDTFVINGNATDYGWGTTEDGAGIVVWGPTGHDILFDFESIRFNDTSISLVQTGNEFQDVANVTQFVTGTSAQETFVINGNSGDYNWGATEDGTGFVVWGPTGHDLLFDIENIAFTDKTISLEVNTGTPVTINDDPNVAQFVTGNDDTTDKFVINDDAANFGWGATEDGEGIVVWNNSSDAHDLLYEIEELVFNDQTIDIDILV